MLRLLCLLSTLFPPSALEVGTLAETPTAISRLDSVLSQITWGWIEENADARLAEILGARSNAGTPMRYLATPSLSNHGSRPKSFAESEDPLRTGQALHRFLGGLTIKLPKELIPGNGIYDEIPGLKINIEEMEVSKIDAQRIKSKLVGSRLSVQFEDVSATVNGKIGWSMIGYKGGDIVFTSELINTHFNFSVHVERREDARYPHNMHVSGCKLEPDFRYETFQCSYVPNFLSAKQLVTKVVKVALRNLACPLVEKYISAQAKATLEMAIEEIQVEHSSPPPGSELDAYVNLRATPLLQVVDEFVKWDLGVEGLNSITKLLYMSFNKSRHRNTPLNISQELLHPFTEEKVADVSLSISGIDVSGIDEVQKLRVPNLADMRDTVSVGTLVEIPRVKTTFQVRLKVQPEASFGKHPVEAFSTIETELVDVQYMIQIAAMLLKSHLPSWRKPSAICPECLLPAVENISFADFSTRFTLKHFRIQPVGDDAGSLERDIDELVNNVATLIGREFRIFTSELVGRIATTRVADVVNDGIRTILGEVQRMFLSPSQLTALKLGNVPEQQNHCKDYGTTVQAEQSRNLFYLFVGTTAAVFILAWQIWLPMVEDRFAVSGNAEVLPWKCLAGESQVPRMLVLTLPFLILTTMCLQTWANCTQTGFVIPTLERMNMRIEFPPVHALSTHDNVDLMIKGKMYVLAAFTLWTCGLLPFVKLAGLMFAWLAPVSILSVRYRGYLLGAIDAFGKWSFMDFFIMSMLMASLHMTVTVGASQVIVKVKALDAFFYSLYVAVITQIFSHACFVYHQQGVEKEAMETFLRGNSQEAATSEDFDPNASREMVRRLKRQYSYVRMPRRVRNILKNRLNLNKEYVLSLVPVLLGLALLLFLVGLFLDVISIDHHGVAGELLNERSRPYNLLSIATYIPHLNSSDPDGVFIRSFQVLFLLLVIGAEGTSLVVLLVAYFVPIHGTFRHTFTTFARTVQAWAALDVFAVGVIGFTYYIAPIQDTLKGELLDIPNYILAEFLPDIGDEPSVFRMDAVLLPGAWFLLMSACISRPIIVLCRWAMHDVSVDTLDQSTGSVPGMVATNAKTANANDQQTELRQCDLRDVEFCD